VPAWMRALQERLGALEGTRDAGDAAEARTPGTAARDTTHDVEAPEPAPFDGEIPPNDHPAGVGLSAIEPKPYRALQERAAPLARALIEKLATEAIPELPAPSERGGRLALRQLVRDPRRPFLLPADERPAPGPLALRLAIDHSTSMNVVTAA